MRLTAVAPAALVVCTTAYAAMLLMLSRRRRRLPGPGVPDGMLVVFVVPALDEERVIGATIESLLGLAGPPSVVLVVDDASTDATGVIVRRFDPERVWLLRRDLPDARQGKGAALNAAFVHLCRPGVLGHLDPDRVVLCVVDADGWMEPQTLIEVLPHFHDPRIAAVQVGVRMINRQENLLARLQDMEFVAFTEIFQRARSTLGIAGLGGNGQFVRLSALQHLGPAPWTDHLTEDLDLGLRLLSRGWRTAFCPTASVHQQAVTALRRLVRQRTRWFQGHLQCWGRIPALLGSPLPLAQVADLLVHLMLAVAVLVVGSFSIALLATFVVLAAVDPGTAAAALQGHPPWFWALAYLVVFGYSWLYAFVYWLRTPTVRFATALAFGHLYLLYGYVWVLAGARAVGRVLAGRWSWQKTQRRSRHVALPVEELAA